MPPRRTLVCVALLACVVACHEAALAPLGTRTAALTLQVPGAYPTIQAAIDAAQAGDLVAVAAGTYTEDLTVKTGIQLVGAGATSTELVGVIHAQGATDVAIRDLALRYPGHGDYGLGGYPAHFEVSGCAFQGFDMAIAVQPSDGRVVRIARNRFRQNEQGVSLEYGTAEVWSNLFEFNPTAGIWSDSTTLDVAGNTFVANGTDEESAQLKLNDCPGQVRENLVVSGGWGIECSSCSFTLTANDVWANTVNYQGPAPGAGDLSVNPRFVDAAGGDYHLEETSPCLDLGGLSGEPAMDLDGRARPEGKARDLGALERGVAISAWTLTEVLANPLDEAKGELIELRNDGAGAQDAAGLVISDGDASDVLVAYQGGGTTVAPGGYAVILDPDYAGGYAIPAGTVLLTVAGGALGNGLAVTDPVTIYEADGVTVIDAFTAPFDPTNGISAELRNGAWVACPCSTTPGSGECPVPAESIERMIITEILANPTDLAGGELVEVKNTGTVALDLAGWVLSDADATDTLKGFAGSTTSVAPGAYAVILDPDHAGGDALPEGVVRLTAVSTATLGDGLALTDPVVLLKPDGTTVMATYTHPVKVPQGTSVERKLEDGPDAEGNWQASACPAGSSPGLPPCFGGPAPATPTLVLSEVLANPLAEDTGELVELYNFGESPVDAAGLRLDDGDQTDLLAGYQGGATVIPPKGYAVVLDPEYAGQYAIPTTAVRLTVAATTTLGSGLATTDPIRLTAADGLATIDTLLAPSDPGNGHSLERIDLLAPDAASNWAPSSCPSGSSPGAPNCVSGGGTPAGPPELVITELMSNPLDEATDEYVELMNPTGAAIDAGGLRLRDPQSTDTLTGWAGGPAVIPALGYAVVLDPDHTPGVPAVLLQDGFEGAALQEWWQVYDPEGVGPPSVSEGRLVLAAGAKGGASGVATKDGAHFPTRRLSLRAVLTVPVTSNDEVVSVSMLLSSAPSGAVSAMDAYVLVRFTAKNANRNVELWGRAPGGAPELWWSWQPGPFAGPQATQNLRLDLDGTYAELRHGQDFLDVFHTRAHGFDLAAFDTVYAVIFAETGGTLGQTYPLEVEEVSFTRAPYDLPQGAVLLTTGDKTIGNGLSATDTLVLETAGGEAVDSFSFPQATPDGVSLEKVIPLGEDAAASWAVAACGPTPGRANCAAPQTRTASWVDRDHSEGGHEWWRAIGYPWWYDPDNSSTSCELVTACPNGNIPYLDNLPATKPFVFTNPYADASVAFAERNGPTDSCFEGSCPAVSVAPGATATVPASSKGYYYVEASTGFNGMDYGFSFYWEPPPDSMMPAFQVVVGE